MGANNGENIPSEVIRDGAGDVQVELMLELASLELISPEGKRRQSTLREICNLRLGDIDLANGMLILPVANADE
jgi:hypothetical protein